MKAFLGNKDLKEKMIEQVKWHEKQDRITQGTYGSNGKYCAVGCSLRSLNIIEGKELGTDIHSRYETELGIPEILARLEDGLFEEMNEKDAKKFPLRFIKAINVGADLSQVFTKLTIWEWRDKKYGLSQIKEIQDDRELFDCCEAVVVLYERTLKGEKVETSEWVKLEELADKIYGVRAGARAWAGARARAGAWAWARARARAGAWAWARAWAGAGAGARAWAWARARAGAWAWAWARARARAGAWAWAWARARAGAGARAGAWAWAWAWARAEYEKQIMVTADKLIEILKETI